MDNLNSKSLKASVIGKISLGTIRQLIIGSSNKSSLSNVNHFWKKAAFRCFFRNIERSTFSSVRKYLNGIMYCVLKIDMFELYICNFNDELGMNYGI